MEFTPPAQRARFEALAESRAQDPSYEDVLQQLEGQAQGKFRAAEQLDPETQARLGRARGVAVGLRGRPLVSGMVARGQVGQGLAEQYRRMSGAPSESQFATTQRGATVGSRVLQQQGPQMAREAGERFGVGMKLGRVRQLAEKGQILFAISERILNSAAKQGILLNEQQATQAAIGVILAGIADHDWDQYRQGPESTTPGQVFGGERGHAGAGTTSFGPIGHEAPAI